MKKTCLKLSLIFVVALMVADTSAQISTYERQPGYWTFGLNGGMAYQQSDIKATLQGFGAGLTLGKNLYYQPGAAFTFDLRGRALYTETYGLDPMPSFGIANNSALNGTFGLDYTDPHGSGMVYHNNKTNHAELGMEAVIGFNKLREQTNIILSVFGGIGLDWYNTTMDQSDVFGNYASRYDALDPTSSVSYKKSQLKSAILDGIYETHAQGFETGSGRLGIMPGLGFELGYQFTPRFSMGLGHKITFTNTDLFDGQQWTNDNQLTIDKDIHHYTNLHIRWILDQREKTLKPPSIKVTIPHNDPHTTHDPNGFVKASIKNVERAMDVRFMVNGYDEQFNFSGETFTSSFPLRQGRNDIRITATNLAGTTQETVVIFYQEPVYEYPPQYPPSVKITQPVYDNFTTESESFAVKANISHVANSRDVRFTVNGTEYRNFSYNGKNGTFSANINLVEGYNHVKIEAQNPDGYAMDETTIILKNTLPPMPVVQIVRPYEAQHYTMEPAVRVEAKIYHVDQKDNVRLTINGRRSSNFSFMNGILVTNLDLFHAKTVVRVEGSNRAGTAADEVVIFYEEWIDEPEEPVIEPPVVKINSMSQPTVDPFDPENCRSTVIATITNIENAGDIVFMLNGQRFYDFTFNPNSGVLKTTIRLEQGINEVVISAQNEAGSDSDRATTAGCKIEKNPPVVTITTPASASVTVTQAETTIVATILNVTRKNDIEFTVNGMQISNFTFDPNSRVFNATVSLEEGNNNLWIKAVNNDGSDQKSVNVFYKKPVIEIPLPPQVTIQKPGNNSKTTIKNVALEAKTLNIGSQDEIEVLLNDSKIQEFVFNKNTQKITAQLSLREGLNNIRVKVTNKDGADEKNVVITFTPPVPAPPIVKFTQPASPTSNVETSDVSISATIKEVKDKNGIAMTVNGKKFSTFIFKNNTLTANLKLQEGQNTIIIKATNQDGNDEDQRVIHYKAPLKPPVVKITTPKTMTTTQQPKTTVKATVQNVSLQKDIQLLVNNEPTAFTFSRNVLSAAVTLKTGENVITVKATNKDGNHEESISITYAPPIPKPVVSFVKPGRQGTTVNTEKTTIEVDVKNVSKKEDITLKVNGKMWKAFEFNPRSQRLTAEISLNDGLNSLTVEAKNDSGTANANSSVRYVKQQIIQVSNPPKVEIISVSEPTVDPFQPDRAKSTIIAKLENIDKKEQITFTINGRSLDTFAFDARSGVFQTTINIGKGKTSIVIKAENPDGSHEASRTITF